MHGAMSQPSRSTWDSAAEADGPVPETASRTSLAADNEQVLQHLNARGFVPFHPALAQHLGHKAALFLGLCLYWTRHSARHNPHRQGWIHLSAVEILDATTLTRREQDTVRAMLASTGLLEQQLAGRPAKMHFRLNLRLLANRLEIIDAATATVETAWAWFEKSVSFYRPLGDLAGSAAGGLYLSFALRQQRKALLAGHLAEFVQLQPEEIERTLCLSPKVQRTVRDRLRRLGLLIAPPTAAMQARINIQAILACVRGQGIAVLPTATPATVQRAVVGARRAPSERRAASVPTRSTLLIDQPDLLMSAGKDQPAGSGTRYDRSMQLLRVVAGARLAVPDPPSAQGQVADFQQLHDLAESPVTGEATATVPSNASAQSAKLVDGPVAQTAKLESFSSAQTAKLERAGSAQSAKLEVPKAPIYIQTEFTNTTTTNRRAIDPQRDRSAACRRRDVEISANAVGDAVASIQPEVDDPDGMASLIYPGALAPTVLPGLRDALRQAPAAQRQQLLDELHGQLQNPVKTIHNPVGWMLGLIRKCREGAVLALAEQVARDRDRRTAVQQQVQAAMPTHDTQVANPQAREEARARLLALRQELIRKGARS
ncbi:hypothetical protein [Pseudorhodoferax sp. Leaf267]|jgi:hypothetical protein|uniref:hypothetical protein n=1 Tax=Pseudorhodoferax sp. Leaf267 TaxID=1736316 RepID=UPI0012E0E269|nr:hypothetical protein [Pseudorhodoferax sp. Leaf267]